MLIKKQTILSKKNIKEYLKECIPNYILIAIIGILYVGLLYFLGKENILDLIKFGILIPILFVVFIVDFKIQIIPNRVNLTLFEIGIVFAFIYALMNINVARDLLLGMAAGGGIFLIIALIGGLIAGKEAMGLRRCKIYGSNRTFFRI